MGLAYSLNYFLYNDLDAIALNTSGSPLNYPSHKIYTQLFRGCLATSFLGLLSPESLMQPCGIHNKQ